MGPGLSWQHGQCQRRGSYCGLRTSLGPSCREHEAGWELKVGPTPQLWCLEPGSVFPGAWGSTSPEGLGRAGLRAVAWDARHWTPRGWQSHLSKLPAGALGTGSKPICLPGRSGGRRLSSLNCF